MQLSEKLSLRRLQSIAQPRAFGVYIIHIHLCRGIRKFDERVQQQTCEYNETDNTKKKKKNSRDGIGYMKKMKEKKVIQSLQC